jgi:FtsP/CotA-like multicopper oxidase with cupredoxin domain
MSRAVLRGYVMLGGWLASLALAGAAFADPAPPASTPLPRVPEAADLDPAPGVLHVSLRAAPTGDATFPYAYNGQHPGPTLRARVGDTLVVDLENALPDATTIHWHGVDVPHAMDGSPHQVPGGHDHDPAPAHDHTAAVAPGARFTYRFPLTRAGTFWYHPHFDTARQVDGGLFGALIVEDPAAPRPDDTLTLIFDRPHEGHHSPRTPAGHGRLTERWHINGAEAPLTHPARGGTTTHVRLINASSTGYLDLRWPAIRHIAGDQGWLPAVQTPDRLLLGPGDRAEVEWLIGAEGFTVQAQPYSLNGGATGHAVIDLINVEVTAPADSIAPPPPPLPLAWPFTGAAVPSDPPYSDIVYVLTGSDRTGVWHINGQRFPDVTVQSVPRGSRPIIEVRNLSPTHHPFHIHGNPFDVLSLDGVPPPYAMLEDTIDIPIHGRLRLQLRADNPGEWMTHCHILPHAEEGMMTLLRVAE